MKYRYNFEGKGKVGLVGFGGWQLGNSENWAGPNYEESITLIKEAYSMGVNFFDTAPNYGSGNSELIIGEALKDVRDNVFINTKVGHGPGGAYEFTPEGIETSIYRSLKKLQTTYLDSVILHNPERYILEGHSDLFNVLKSFKLKGLIRKYGVSIDSLEELKLVLDNTDVDTIEIMFNIIHQEPKYLFDAIKEKNILLIIKVPLDSGWLTGKYDKESDFTGIRSRWSKETIEIRADIIDKIKRIVNTDNLVSPSLKFISKFNAVSVIIPGVKNSQQLISNVESLNYDLSKEKHKELEDLYENYINKIETPW